MDKYIYFAAEMPALKWDTDQFISIRAFLEEAAKWLTPADHSVLLHSVLHRYEPRNVNGVYRSFLSFEHNLREELANYRKALKEGYEYKIAHIPPQLVKEGNPLEIEKKLMQYRWKWLDEQEFGHYSDLDFFVIYYLKLQLLHRLANFEEKAGREAYEVFVNQNPDKNEKTEESP